ncbi:hypothetical protein CYG49_01185 [Candidatus Saccharibacteria bacterium]|nr:MAG: hypothetical protein CYG49_01185 [Candidatus Saccharibacteria bacterium]
MLAILIGLGPAAAFIALVLIVIEITFSFENAIINAKVLATLSPFWQKIFLTIGIAIAIFGMRIVFPIAIVAITAAIPWQSVLQLALERPDEYAEALEKAHVSIAAFGGMFLVMLFFHFFLDPKRKVLWLERIEGPLQRIAKPWTYIPVAAVVLLVISALPFNTHKQETFVAGFVGFALYLLIHGLAAFFGKTQDITKGAAKTGMAGFIGFMYLEVLDASFSFDGVIGAFAVTNSVILIAAGLGVGAVWVRSLTVFMVRRKILRSYRFLEHGAHYTIGVLATVLLASLFVHIPELIAGIAGIILIGSSILASVAANKAQLKKS